MVAIHARDFVSSMRKAEQGGKVVYTYAQTTICDCLYVGDQAAYGRYRENAFQKNLANEQQMNAVVSPDPVWSSWGQPGGNNHLVC